jgi:hypothetical protein
MRASKTALQLLMLLAATAVTPAHAVPSYAREMKVPCSTCHTLYPQLSAFGRQFKLDGYALDGSAAAGVETQEGDGRRSLTLDAFPPLSVMLTTAWTNVAATVPDTQNNNVQFPQEASIFIAGRITPGLGSFLQVTYSQEENALSLDNAELRYSKAGTFRGQPVRFGAILNNNPTVEDLWNSTPAWGYPWAGPDSTPAPPTAALVDGTLGQDVLGAGGFASIDNKYYIVSTLYRSAHLGSSAPSGDSENTIDGVAPYWRFMWQHPMGARYLALGTYGMRAKVFPQGVSGESDTYRDLALDAQYEQPFGSRALRVHGTYIRENQNLDASVLAGLAEQSHYQLDTLRLDAGIYGSQFAFILGHTMLNGDADATRFAPGAVEGSLNGKPDANAWIGEVVYSPWQNIQLRAQYTAYQDFNGTSNNYDGFGRDAADNNTLMLHAWLAW